MNPESHRKAEQLILQERVEGLSEAERSWLSGHLETCAECSLLSDSTGRAIGTLRTALVEVPAGLAERTQARVYLRALERRQRAHRMWMLWVTCAISWGLGIASAPYVWRGFRWVGGHTGLPDAIWKTGFVLWWALPALVLVSMLLVERWGAKEIEREV